jgi:hypothetical protein
MIYTEKNQFWPSDEVSGHVVVSTDETFTCNRIILKIRGKEYTHYQAGKVHVSETHQILDDDITIWEGGNIHSGDTKFEFNFKLPDDIPPTHSGIFCQIDYSIEAVVEVDRAFDPKSKMEINVFARVSSYIPETLDRLPIREETEHLHAEIPTDILRPNKGLEVRFLVKERSRIKGVRLDIVMHNDVVCQGRNLDSDTGVSEKRIPIIYRDFDRWIDATIHEDWSSMGSFEGKLIKSSLMLKVVLEVGLSFDPCIEFPLRLSGEKEKEDDIFDSIEMDLGW